LMEQVTEDGTRTILDIFFVSEAPAPCAASPADESVIQHAFGTPRPTRAQIEAALSDGESAGFEEFMAQIGRGEARYVVVFRDGQPEEIFFAGFSFD
jgi:hypothetical protein